MSIVMKEIIVYQILGDQCFPKVDHNYWSAACEDQTGADWSARHEFATESEAQAMVEKPFSEDNWFYQGFSYAKGRVDERDLMDESELSRYRY